MMEIIFNQHYDDGYYLDFSIDENQKRFNKAITGPLGLLDILERDFGLGGKFLSGIERKIFYRSSIAEYIDENPGSFLEKSFKNDPGGVAAEMLKYRDQLILSGWTDQISDISPKIDFLAALEKKRVIPSGIEDRWISVLNELKEDKEIILSISCISLTEKITAMHPFFGILFESLQTKGISINYYESDYNINEETNLGRIQDLLVHPVSNSIELDEKGKLSFQILSFKNETEAAEFIASQSKNLKKTAIINSNNSLFDELQNSFGRPVSGSVQNDSNPQVIQLFKLISTLFIKPLNIDNFMAYLQVNVHPVPIALRYKLLEKITLTGGVKNPEWYQVIDEYEFKDFQHKEDITGFLQIREFEPGILNREEVIKIYRTLFSWTNKRIILSDGDDKKLIAQLLCLQGMCNALDKALIDIDSETITNQDFSMIQRDVYEPMKVLNYSAQENSCPVVSTPGNLLTYPLTCVWLDFYNSEIKPGYYDFLNGTEAEKLIAKGLKLWSSSDQVISTLELYMDGILKSSERCVLVVAEKNRDQLTLEHPLMSLLKASVSNLNSFILKPGYIDGGDIQNFGWSASDYKSIQSATLPEKKMVYIIGNGDLVRARKTESSSSIELMLQYPFDWVLQYATKVKPQNSFRLGDAETTMGKVAHKFIEVLLKKAEYDISKATELMNGYSSMLHELVQQYGVMLLLDEYRFDFERFKSKLKSAMYELFEIIQANNFKVIGIEKEFKENLGQLGGQKVQGFVDMILENKDGEKIIFDMKWSRSEKKYPVKMGENRHIQLALYKAIVEMAEKKKVSLVAYYMISQAKLLSPVQLQGNAVRVIPNVKDENEILTKVSNSINYRRSQFNSGIIEECEEQEVGELEYIKETETKNLLPLETSGKNKKKNYYSAYNVLKGDII